MQGHWIGLGFSSLRRQRLTRLRPRTKLPFRKLPPASRPALPSPSRAAEPAHAPVPAAKSKWQTYGTPLLVVLLALAVLITITRNWNAWEGGRVEQVTDDASVRGDSTPLGTKVAGIVRDGRVTDFQQVHKSDILVELESNDYQAQVAQATAAVEAARAALEDNRRQRELEDARIQRALAGVDEATPRSDPHRTASRP